MPSASLGHSAGVGSSRTINRLKGPVNSVDWLGGEMLEKRIRDNKLDVDDEKDIEPPILYGMYDYAKPGHIKVKTIGGRNGQPNQTIRYIEKDEVGRGKYGVVYKAECVEDGGSFAIKKVEDNKENKNPEPQILYKLKHPNIVALKHCFRTKTDKGERYLHLVLEYVPKTVCSRAEYYKRNNERMPLIFVKLYIYQLCRSLAYIHSLNLCHRDIYPQNLLVNPDTHQLKLCDFGNAKFQVEGEGNICTGYYLAPELLIDNDKWRTAMDRWSTAIDMWSTGCLMAELLLGEPLLWKEKHVDLVAEIKRRNCKTPNSTEPKVLQMRSHLGNERRNCKNCKTEFKFDDMKSLTGRKELEKCLPAKVVALLSKPLPAKAVGSVRKPIPAKAVDLVSKLLKYWPERRYTALDACTHSFFDELRDPKTRLPDGKPLPRLFDLTDQELTAIPQDTLERLIPKRAEAELIYGPTHESQG